MRTRPVLVTVAVTVFLVAGALSAVPGAAAPPSDRVAPRPAIGAAPVHPLQGNAVTIRTKVPSKGKKRPVALERLVNGAWRVQAAKRTTARGRVAFVVTAIGPTTWRVRARAVKIGKKRLTKVITRRLALQPTPRAVLASIATNGRSPGVESGIASISGDGRYLAFHSSARTLVAGYDGYVGESPNVYVRDRVAGTTTLVSAADSNTVGNSDSSRPAISRNGRFVAFASYADNLVAGDDNETQDIFRWDRQTGTIIRVSRAAAGGDADDASHDPSISADGERIAYSSAAENIVNDDDNGVSDMFVWDAATGESERVSESTLGAQGNAASLGGGISADGAYVAFTSAATTLTFNDENGTPDVFRKNLSSGALALVTSTPGGADDYTSYSVSISGTGRYVGFASAADNLIPGGTPDNGATHTFVRDMTAGTTTWVSRDRNGGAANNHAFAPSSISDDGSLVAYTARASDLVAGDTNGVSDGFLWSRSTGRSVRVVRDLLWGQVDGAVYEMQLSANGAWFAFYSVARDLSPRDTNAASDAYFWRR